MLDSEEYFKNFRDVALIVEEGQVIKVNRSAKLLFEISDYRILFSSFIKEFLYDNQPIGVNLRLLFDDYLQKCEETGYSSFEYLHKNIWYEVSVTKTGVKKYFISFKDISFYKKFDASNKINYKSLAECSPDTIIRFDKEFRILYASENIYDLLHLNFEDLLGKTIFDIGFNSEIIDLLTYNISSVFINRSRQRVELRLPTGIFIDLYMVPEFAVGDEISSVVATARDITELKTTQEKVSRNHDILTDAFKMARLSTWEIDVKLNKIFVNSFLPESDGKSYNFKEFLNKYVLEDHHENILQTIKECINTEDVNHKASLNYQVVAGQSVRSFITNLKVRKNSIGNTVLIYGTSYDITELIKARQELKLSNEKLLDAMKTANLTNWDLDLTTGNGQVHQHFLANLGIHVKDEIYTFTLDEVFNYVIDTEKRRLLKAFVELIGSDEPNRLKFIEFKLEIKERIFTISAGFRVKTDTNGKPIFCYGTAQDISRLKEAEDELQEYRENLESLIEIRTQELISSRSHLQDALELAQLGTWEIDVMDKPGVFVGSNMSQNIIGISSPNLKTEDYMKLIHPEDLDCYFESQKSAVEAKPGDKLENIEYRIIKPDGEIAHLYISTKVLHDDEGNLVKLYGNIQDITPIKKAQEEKDRLTKLIESSSDIICLINKDKTIEYMNKAGMDFYGLSSQDNLKGQSISRFQPNNSVSRNPEIWETIEKEGFWMGENVELKHDGTEFPVSQLIMAHYNRDGQLDCYSTVIRDISMQKKIEEELRYKNHELDTFVYKASHDLKGPITSLIGLYTLVKYDITDEQSLEYFQRYNTQINRLNDLLNDLLSLTKIKDKKAERSAIDLENEVYEFIDTYEDKSANSDLKFNVDIDNNLVIYSDKLLIRTILQNLIENAVKYSDTSKPDPYVAIKAKVCDSWLTIEVSDNGIGIEAEHQKNIYNMFYRATENSTGSGLGLYLLKNAVDKLNGQLKLKSSPGVGTTFNLKIPSVIKEEPTFSQVSG
ncbi:PAS domain-containing sensor histidine kinase [Marinigracilibium pacificum]|uniref:histidine kinase n=1 Tax=Marinigracilibium pacificum TaxID=2729599 RepID=A0A848J4Q5_9BACT|nr:PAS domain S-box protein [Marinigracilibium pacificum]NMM50465.1 PAS domain-containing sensor histidine kinase [Marinigracilibium pacificum]